jgi:hemolysin-activating ACP:hemolysin acyltransferase
MNDQRPPKSSPLTEADLEKLLKISRDLNCVLGEAVSLMVAMPRYQGWRLADIRARILPPIALQQCKIFRHKGFPVAFVSWSLVSEEIERRLESNPELPLTASEWRSGSRLCFIDIASPKGNEEEIKDAVRKQMAEGASTGSAHEQAGRRLTRIGGSS